MMEGILSIALRKLRAAANGSAIATPDGAVVKHSAVPEAMHRAVLRARPFDCEEEAIGAVLGLFFA